MLEQSGQARGATVSVEFVDLGVTVLGEVKAPGRKAIDRDSYTVLDALAAAGDLNIDAVRELRVQRPEGDNGQAAKPVATDWLTLLRHILADRFHAENQAMRLPAAAILQRLDTLMQ